jgi:hypothetical protein
LFLSLLCQGKVFAARSISIISVNKDTLLGDEDLNIVASPSGFASDEQFYIKGAFYQDISSPNYFGYTKNGDNWIKNSDSVVNQKLVKLNEWDDSLTTKVDFLDSGYKGEDSYKFKIGFYYITSGGKTSSVNWSSNNVDIMVNEPDPTPTPDLSPVETLTPTANPVAVLIKSTPTPTFKPAATTTLKPSPTTMKVLIATKTTVLGISSKSAEIQNPTSTVQPIRIASASKNNLLAEILISLGIVFLLACGIVFSYPYIIRFINKSNE